MSKKIIIGILSFFLCLNVKALTMAPVDVTKMDIGELLEAMDKGYLTSEMLVHIYLERIEAYDEQFNAINQLSDNAINEAKELDEMRKKGEIKGKLHGIPILVKSNIDVRGLSTNAGTLALNNNYPMDDATVVSKLKEEGAIILGSCNMSALAFSASASYGSFGHVKNVFDVNKTPFGSSGGSAVSVKANFAAAALGTDTNSSVRAPASGAGIVGIRPTYGLVSHSGVLPYDFERDTVGVLSNNVSDSALLLSIISGSDENDVTTKDAIKKEYNIDNASLKGTKIGVLTQYVEGSSKESGVTGLTDPEIYELLKQSIAKLESSGAEIIYLDKFVKNSNLKIANSTMAGGTFCDYFNEYIKRTTGPITNFKELANAKGSVWNLSGYVDSCGVQINKKDERDAKKKEYADYVKDYFLEYDLDVVLYPTLKNKVPDENKSNNNVLPGRTFGSVIGFPSLTMPMGKISDNMSYGIEFLSLPYAEDKIYNVAASFEDINNNEVSSSPLTPSLYSVPDAVTKLIDVYENRSNSDSLREWEKEVNYFFSNYNNIEDIENHANKLLDSYDEKVKDSKNNNDNNDKNIEINTNYVILGLIIICLLIILKNIFLV